MKNLFSLLAVLLCAAVLSTSVFAADTTVSYRPQDDVESPPQRYRITMGATVVSNRGGALAVYLKSPKNMAVQEGDETRPFYLLPVDETTAATDAQGKAIPLTEIVTGQTVRVTFRFYYQSTTPRTAPVAEKCIAVALLGDTLKRKSAASVDDFDRGVLVGVVLPAVDGKPQVHIESGRMAYGSTEYQVGGGYTRPLTLAKNGVVLDAAGKKIALTDLKPYQRVVMTVGEAMWAESFPPQFVLGTVSRVQALKQGEKLFDPAELAALETMTCTVTGTQKLEDGRIQLTVRPDEGSRELQYAPEYTVDEAFMGDLFDSVFASEGSAVKFSSITTGARLRIRYEGLNYGDGKGAISWYHRMEILE